MVPIRYKAAFLQGVLGGGVARTGPFFVTLSVTDRCNMRCIGCAFHSPERNVPRCKDMPLQVVEKVSGELAAIGTKEIFLSGGGEPTLHPQLWEIVRLFKKAQMRVTLFSNGTLLDEKNVQQLIHSGVDVLKVSLWAVNRQEHVECHPGINPEMLTARLRGIRRVAELKAQHRLANPLINLHMVINSLNWRNLAERVDLAAASRCDSLSFGVFRDYDGCHESLSLSAADVKLFEHELRQVRKKLQSKKIACNWRDYLYHARRGYNAWRLIPCYAGYFQSVIQTDGGLLPCPRSEKCLADLKKHSFAEVWNSAVYREFRRKGMTGGGASMSEFACDCANCCLIKDNLRVHNRVKWIKPVLNLISG